MSQARESVNLRAERIREWRDAGDCALRAYRAWCAASRSDRHGLYVYFLDALRREERAAWQVERGAAGQGSADLACQQTSAMSRHMFLRNVDYRKRRRRRAE